MKISNLFKDVFIYGIGDVSLKILSFITLPIYTRVFSPEDFGILTFSITFSGLFSQLLELGINSAYARYFFELKTINERRTLTTTALLLIFGWATFITFAILPFTENFSNWFFNNPKYSTLLILSLLINPLALVNGLGSQVLRNQFKAITFTVLNVLTTLLSIVLAVYFILVFKLGINGFILATLIANILILPFRLWSIKDYLITSLSGTYLRNMLSYGIPLVPMSLAYWVFISSDRLVLGKLSTLEQLGLYSLANSIASILGFLNTALGQAFSPHIIKVYEQESELAPKFIGKCLTYILASFGFFCVVMTAFSREILMLLSTVEFYPAALAVGPLALGFIALATTQVTALGITLTKKTYYFIFCSWFAALLNLVLNIIFVPSLGMLAASWSTTLTYIFLTFSYGIISQKLFFVYYQKPKIFTLTIAALVFTLTIPFLPSFNLVIDVILKLIYTLIYGGLLIYLLEIRKAEINRLVIFFKLSAAKK